MDKHTMYATDIGILSSEYQMIITFQCKIPPNPVCDNPDDPISNIATSQVILSPQHFKKLQIVMAGLVEKHEQQFGVIKLSEEVAQKVD